MKRKVAVLTAVLMVVALIFVIGCGGTTCPQCDGTGDCPACNGTGKISGVSCPGCLGTGVCQSCDGTGKI